MMFGHNLKFQGENQVAGEQRRRVEVNILRAEGESNIPIAELAMSWF